MVSRDEYLENFRRRILWDAWQEAQPDYWRRRAATFRKVGTAEADRIALACENKARLCELDPVEGAA